MVKECKIAVVICESCGRKLPKLDSYSISVRKHNGRFVVGRPWACNEDHKVPLYDSSLLFFCKDCFAKENISKFVKFVTPKPEKIECEEDLYSNRFFGPH